MDIFSTNVLAKVVERLHTPSSFLLDTFFPNVQTSDKEEIFFDVTDSKPRNIRDPWYTGNFDESYWDIYEGCQAFLDSLDLRA